MKIYTKGGDAGETGLFGGTRVPKDDLRIRSYGTLDELNAVLGLALAQPKLSSDVRAQLTRIQEELFTLGAELATPRGKKLSINPLQKSQISALEMEIDEMDGQLPPLKTFILPGGSMEAAWVHLARTVSRRAEREIISLNRADSQRAEVLQYVNRLSDYFFVLARYLNWKNQVEDVPWNPKSS